MKKMRLFLSIAFITTYLNTLSQVQLPPIFSKIISSPKEQIIASLSRDNFPISLNLPSEILQNGYYFTKTRKGLFLFPNGTGQVIQISKNDADQLQFTRIDSTYFSGYNFYALYFPVDTTIYCFGGTGFWTYFPTLRHFNEKSHQWDAQPLSEDIPRHFIHDAPNFHYVDIEQKKLYVIGPSHFIGHLTFSKKVPEYANKLQCLDLETGIWTALGEAKDTVFNPAVNTPLGLFVNNTFILDLKNNQIYNPKGSFQAKMSAVSSSAYRNNTRILLECCIDSTVYFGDFNNWIDSIKLDRSDFEPSGKPFYKPYRSHTNRYLYFIIAAFLFLIPLIIWFLKKKNSRSVSTKTEQTDAVGQLKNNMKNLSFDERERSLLKLIFQNSIQQSTTNIDEINTNLGITQRSIEVQKRMRSDLINSIQTKAVLLYGEKTELIQKKRSAFDKRSFEYFINPDFVELTKRILEK